MVQKLIQLRRSNEHADVVQPLFRHLVFAWLGICPVWGQRTEAEREALRKWATEKSNLVEIGVAEGSSAIDLRDVMSGSETLWLIDPFHLGRVPGINPTKRAAHRVVGKSSNGTVVWIEKFSFEAVKGWRHKIDFLFLDGDHSEQGIQRDWEDWHAFVIPGGVIAFHDAAVFPLGWTRPDWGPVRLVDRLFRSQSLAEWKIAQEVDSLALVQRLEVVRQS